jgi:hypothetical protein
MFVEEPRMRVLYSTAALGEGVAVSWLSFVVVVVVVDGFEILIRYDPSSTLETSVCATK